MIVTPLQAALYQLGLTVVATLPRPFRRLFEWAHGGPFDAPQNRNSTRTEGE